jgi:hypothetical protein
MQRSQNARTRLHSLHPKLLALALSTAALVGWTPILHEQGAFKPALRWAYFLGGGSGPAPGQGIGPHPTVDVTGPYAGSMHCYT